MGYVGAGESGSWRAGVGHAGVDYVGVGCIIQGLKWAVKNFTE